MDRNTFSSGFFSKVFAPLLLTYALLPLACLIPLVDPTAAPFVDLTSRFALGVYWITTTGTPIGATIIGVFMTIYLATRNGIRDRHRVREALVLMFVAVAAAGGGASVNEYVVKPIWRAPRPNIEYLAGEAGTGPLGMSAVEFYGRGDKSVRSKLLSTVLATQPPPIPIGTSVRDHWIKETGYSFPSGHAFAAMCLATFFLATEVTFAERNRRGWFYLLLPWAVLVAYSRPLLRVHTPTDIAVGGLVGMVTGFMAFGVLYACVARLRRSTGFDQSRGASLATG